MNNIGCASKVRSQMPIYLLIVLQNLIIIRTSKMQFVGLVPADCFKKSLTPRDSKKLFKNTLPPLGQDLLYFEPDENIGIHRGTHEYRRCRNLATQPGGSLWISQNFFFYIFYRLYRLAKAFGFCLYFLLSPWSKATPRDRVHMDSIALTGLQNDITKQVFT